MLAGCQSPFQSRDGRWLRSHTFRYLCLSEARCFTCLEQSIQQSAFIALNTLNLGTNTRPAHELSDNLIMRSHVHGLFPRLL